MPCDEALLQRFSNLTDMLDRHFNRVWLSHPDSGPGRQCNLLEATLQHFGLRVFLMSMLDSASRADLVPVPMQQDKSTLSTQARCVMLTCRSPKCLQSFGNIGRPRPASSASSLRQISNYFLKRYAPANNVLPPRSMRMGDYKSLILISIV